MPRQVGLTATASGVLLTQQPVAELESRRAGVRRWRGVLGESAPEFTGTALDVVAEFRLGTASAFGFDVFSGGGWRTRVGYDADAGELFVDRTQSGSAPVGPTFPARHGTPLDPAGEVLRIRLLADRCCVEVFGDRGQAVLTDLVLPDAGADRLCLFSAGGRVEVISLEVHELA